MRTMVQKTSHTVTIDVCLSPSELMENYTTKCKVWLRSIKPIFPWFFPILHKTITIGMISITLTHEETSFPIEVVLPKVRRNTNFDVFVTLLGNEYVASESIIVEAKQW